MQIEDKKALAKKLAGIDPPGASRSPRYFVIHGAGVRTCPTPAG